MKQFKIRKSRRMDQNPGHLNEGQALALISLTTSSELGTQQPNMPGCKEEEPMVEIEPTTSRLLSRQTFGPRIIASQFPAVKWFGVVWPQR